MNVVCHGEAARALVLVPVEVDVRKFCPVPVLYDGVIVLEGVTQMFGTLSTNTLNYKIFDNEAEGYGMTFVAP